MTRLIPLLLPLLLFTACTDDPPPAPPTEKPPDTTSHEISWSVSYLGDAETVLSKLFAVGDSIVYVVGRIRVRDSVGKLVSYNAARWDGGDTWSLLQIPVLICGTDISDPIELRTGFGYDEQKLHFFTAAKSIQRIDTGYVTDCELQFKLYGSIQNVFAYSEDDYYIVGGNSTVIHWNGVGFIREETGTRWETRDIYGNEHDLWVVAGTPSNYKGGVLHKSRSGSWGVVDSLSDGGTRSVNSVWCDDRSYENGGFVILAGRGIWYRDTTWKRPPKDVTGGNLGLGDLYFNTVRGRGRNDVFAAGHFDIVTHFNGRTWKHYTELFKYPGGGILTSIAIIRNDVFICGAYPDGKGRIIHGRRKK